MEAALSKYGSKAPNLMLALAMVGLAVAFYDSYALYYD